MLLSVLLDVIIFEFLFGSCMHTVKLSSLLSCAFDCCIFSKTKINAASQNFKLNINTFIQNLREPPLSSFSKILLFDFRP